MLQDLFKRYSEEICTTCKAKECVKGICVVQSNILQVQCVDYIKDENKIKPSEKEILPTANKRRIRLSEII